MRGAYSFLDGSLLASDGSWNKVNFSDARVDELTAAMGVETDIKKRNEMIAEAWDIVQDNVEYLSAMEETKYTIAQANTKLDKNGKIIEDLVSCRQNLNFLLSLSLIHISEPTRPY